AWQQRNWPKPYSGTSPESPEPLSGCHDHKNHQRVR
ncbi:small acid-soluble spore protein P, partial [Parasphingorhabdus sp.]